MVQVFALQKYLRSAHFAAHALGVVHGRGATYIVRQLVFELGDKFGVVLVFGVGGFELVHGAVEGFGDKCAAILAEVALGIGLVVVGHGEGLFQSIQIRVQNAETAKTSQKTQKDIIKMAFFCVLCAPFAISSSGCWVC